MASRWPRSGARRSSRPTTTRTSSQGTVGAEICEDVEDLDTLVVCIGGGGLISGSSIAATAQYPGLRVIGVEPEAGDDTKQSLEAGHRVTIDVPRTIADGQQLTSPGALTFPIIQRLVERVVTVTDEEIVAAMAFAAERCKLVLEPSGASALAAVLTGAVDVAGQRTAVILSGGNVDRSRYLELLAGAPAEV